MLWLLRIVRKQPYAVVLEDVIFSALFRLHLWEIRSALVCEKVQQCQWMIDRYAVAVKNMKQQLNIFHVSHVNSLFL